MDTDTVSTVMSASASLAATMLRFSRTFVEKIGSSFSVIHLSFTLLLQRLIVESSVKVRGPQSVSYPASNPYIDREKNSTTVHYLLLLRWNFDEFVSLFEVSINSCSGLCLFNSDGINPE